LTTNYLNLKFYQGDIGEISGKVTKIYKQDYDFINDHAVLIECPDSRAFYVPLYRRQAVLESGKYRAIVEGDTVIMTPVQDEKGKLTPEFRAAGGDLVSRLFMRISC